MNRERWQLTIPDLSKSDFDWMISLGIEVCQIPVMNAVYINGMANYTTVRYTTVLQTTNTQHSTLLNLKYGNKLIPQQGYTFD